MECKKIVEIYAPDYGCVEDINIYGASTSAATRIAADLEKKSFTHQTKAEIDWFELTQQPNGLSLELKAEGLQTKYELKGAYAEATYGGNAYNTFQDLYALQRALGGRLTLRPIIGLPPQLIHTLRTNGMHDESGYFLPHEGRKSLMIIHERGQLNLVVKGKPTCSPARQHLPPPDIAIYSTYPEGMNAQAIDEIIQYRENNPNMHVYFNPGSTQVRMGIQQCRALMPLVSLAMMKLDEAEKFLGITPASHHHYIRARECSTRLLDAGAIMCVLNDSENGSYMGCKDAPHPCHVPPFPKQPIEELMKRGDGTVVENFSGCGDSLFSAMVYATEVHLEMTIEHRLVFATSIARLISLLPESNLYGTPGNTIQRTFELSTTTH